MAGPRASDAHPRAGDCTGGRVLCTALACALELARAVAKAVARCRRNFQLLVLYHSATDV